MEILADLSEVQSERLKLSQMTVTRLQDRLIETVERVQILSTQFDTLDKHYEELKAVINRKPSKIERALQYGVPIVLGLTAAAISR